MERPAFIFLQNLAHHLSQVAQGLRAVAGERRAVHRRDRLGRERDQFLQIAFGLPRVGLIAAKRPGVKSNHRFARPFDDAFIGQRFDIAALMK